MHQTLTQQAISLDNQLILVSKHFERHSDQLDYDQLDYDQLDYFNWLDAQANPPISYHDHPIPSEDQLNQLKSAFQQVFAYSLGAYVRIKRAYYLLNHSADFTDSASVDSHNTCQFAYLSTPQGNMLAIFYDKKLCLLEFLQRKMLITELKDILKHTGCRFEFVKTAEHDKLQTQLNEYFAGTRQTFDIELMTIGTDFQKSVWQTLQTIDYGTTISYEAEAERMGKPTAFRAVANANGKNKIAIVIPCHRVVRKNGDLGGYGGGIVNKRALLALESASSVDSTI